VQTKKKPLACQVKKRLSSKIFLLNPDICSESGTFIPPLLSMNREACHIQVAVALPVHGEFTYAVPEPMVPLVGRGKRVLVPFGNRRVTGYVLGFGGDAPAGQIRPVEDILDNEPLFPESIISFYRWISDYYLHPLGEVIRTALPGGLNVYDQVSLRLSAAGQRALDRGGVTIPEAGLLGRLSGGSRTLRACLGNRRSADDRAQVMKLVKRGWVREERQLAGKSVRARTERFVSLPEPPPAVETLTAKRREILERVPAGIDVPVRRLARTVPTASQLVTAMARSGQLNVFKKQVYRDLLGDPVTADTPHRLNAEQAEVVDRVRAALKGGFQAFLLNGVTGSGKTEVYMHLARTVLDRGGRVLVLVPEIALISQMARRFEARFGSGIAMLHSGLSRGERYDQWLRIMRGEAAIAIGARSAVFAPFADLGLVIVDEEHDGSYKQDGGLRYNARDLAVVRARQNHAVVLLGSATPSVQSFANVASKKFSELRLTRRVAARCLPEIRVVDLKETRDARGIHRFMTPALVSAMERRLDAGEQVLLFLNRRGFAGYPVCAACGEALRCRHCDISLTLHQAANAYRCHYCGFSRPSIIPCPACGEKKIKNLGLGTERVEAAVTALFPHARVARMDRDTTGRRGAVVKILKNLSRGKIDVLVGTQMVAKGHDFPNITLVGVICADLSLNFPDFRAGERTFQLLAQVAGRAGRGDTPGRVILQTYNPDHFSIRSAVAQDFSAFYRTEIGFRQELGYPPFSRLVLLRISGKDKSKTRDHAAEVGAQCHALAGQHGGSENTVTVMGPIEASLTRVAGRYRWQVLLKCAGAASVHRFVGALMQTHPTLFSNTAVRVAVDVDPVHFM
jgi:primosomal protein N' (replication factor Y) (superfamily II helicase)